MLRLLVEFAVKQIVSDQDKVSISETLNGSSSAIEIRVGQDDIGKIIGKEGRTIKALRAMVNVVAANNGITATLDIIGA